MTDQQISELEFYQSFNVKLDSYFGIINKMKDCYENWKADHHMTDEQRLYNAYAIIIDTLSNNAPRMPNNIIFVVLGYVQVKSQDYIYRPLTGSIGYYKHTRVLSYFKDGLIRLFKLPQVVNNQENNENNLNNLNIQSCDFQFEIRNFVIYYIQSNPEFANEINRIYSDLLKEYEIKKITCEKEKQRAFDMYHTEEAIQMHQKYMTLIKETAEKCSSKIQEYNMTEEQRIQVGEQACQENRKPLSECIADIVSQGDEQSRILALECEQIEINLNGLIDPDDRIRSINNYYDYHLKEPESLFGFYQSVCLEFDQSKQIPIQITLGKIINSIDSFQPNDKFGIVLPVCDINLQIYQFIKLMIMSENTRDSM